LYGSDNLSLERSDNRSLGAVSSKQGEELTMATTTHVPVEVYLRSSYEPDAEYIDGIQRNDTFSHAEKGIVFDMNQLKNLLD
jgi:hypothetical protein